MHTGNKGEWSEIYTLLKLIADGEMLKGDSQLTPISGESYKVIALERHEATTGATSYTIKGETVEISNSEESVTRYRDIFRIEAARLLEIIKTKKATFDIPAIEGFMNEILAFSIKAKSQDKTDIKVEIIDHRTNIAHARGFSIKSQLGSPSTLLNASGHTLFDYKIDGLSEFDKNRINEISGNRCVQKKVSEIEKLKSSGGITICNGNARSDVFRHNLVLLDDALPDILASLMYNGYKHKTTRLNELLAHVVNDNIRGYQFDDNATVYSQKIKRLLVASALGMKPASNWQGEYDASGGYLVVLNNGKIISYHIYDKEDFENYLFYNTRLDTPDPTRYNSGEITTADGCHYMQLGLQIRFCI
jgi:hypothetical protein